MIRPLKCVNPEVEQQQFSQQLISSRRVVFRFFCFSLTSLNFTYRYLCFCWLFSSLKWYIRRVYGTVLAFPPLDESANRKSKFRRCTALAQNLIAAGLLANLIADIRLGSFSKPLFPLLQRVFLHPLVKQTGRRITRLVFKKMCNFLNSTRLTD